MYVLGTFLKIIDVPYKPFHKLSGYITVNVVHVAIGHS